MYKKIENIEECLMKLLDIIKINLETLNSKLVLSKLFERNE